MLKPTDRTRANARRSRRDPTVAEAAIWRLLRIAGWDHQVLLLSGVGDRRRLRRRRKKK